MSSVWWGFLEKLFESTPTFYCTRCTLCHVIDSPALLSKKQRGYKKVLRRKVQWYWSLNPKKVHLTPAHPSAAQTKKNTQTSCFSGESTGLTWGSAPHNILWKIRTLRFRIWSTRNDTPGTWNIRSSGLVDVSLKQMGGNVNSIHVKLITTQQTNHLKNCREPWTIEIHLSNRMGSLRQVYPLVAGWLYSKRTVRFPHADPSHPLPHDWEIRTPGRVRTCKKERSFCRSLNLKS